MGVNDNQVTLKEWVEAHPSDEFRLLFYNVDGTMQYIHQKGYAVDDFSLNEIFVIANKDIRFHKLVELSQDNYQRMNMIHDNIFKSALIKASIYFGKGTPDLSLEQIVNTLSSNGGNIIKADFDSYAKYLPESDVDYFRRVIQDGESLYYNEYYYDIEIKKAQSENEVGTSNTNTKQLVKASTQNIGVAPITSDIDVSMYRKIDKDSAFINYYVISTLIFVIGLVISFIIWVLKI